MADTYRACAGVCGGHVAACHTFILRPTAVILATGCSGNQGKANYCDGGTGGGGAARHFSRINALLTAS